MNPEHNDSDTHTGEAMADAPAAGEDFNAVLAAAAVRNEGAELDAELGTERDTKRDADAGEEADPMNDDDAPLRVRPSWGAALSQLPGLPAFEISFADMGNSAARVVSFKTSGDVEEREVIYRGDARRTRRVEPQYPSDAAEDIDNMDDGANHYADEALENDDDGVDDVIPSREHERTLRY